MSFLRSNRFIMMILIILGTFAATAGIYIFLKADRYVVAANNRFIGPLIFAIGFLLLAVAMGLSTIKSFGKIVGVITIGTTALGSFGIAGLAYLLAEEPLSKQTIAISSDKEFEVVVETWPNGSDLVDEIYLQSRQSIFSRRVMLGCYLQSITSNIQKARFSGHEEIEIVRGDGERRLLRFNADSVEVNNRLPHDICTP